MNPAVCRFAFIEQFGQTKIQNLHLACIGNHDVAGLDVAMDDATRVRGRERVSHLNSDAQSALEFQWPAVNQLAHIAAFDVLHRDEVQAPGLVHVKDSADVGMIER